MFEISDGDAEFLSTMRLASPNDSGSNVHIGTIQSHPIH